MRSEAITMAMRELDRMRVVQSVCDGALTQTRAAERLGLTPRQARHLRTRPCNHSAPRYPVRARRATY